MKNCLEKEKKYRIKNDPNNELEWTLKKYRVDNDKSDDTLCGNHLDNVDIYSYYFDISNNGEIPDDELNYQTSNINSIEETSTMKWKIMVRQLGSDMNDHSKQDQHNQRKQLIN